LAKSLYQEVCADSWIVQKINRMRLKKEERLVFFSNALKDSNLDSPPKQFYSAFVWVFFISTAITFGPSDGVLPNY